MNLIKICLLASFLMAPLITQASSVIDRLKALQGTTKYAEHEQAIIDLRKMILRFPKKMDGTWETKDVSTIIDYLLIEKDHVYRQQLIEGAITPFRDNRKAIGKFLAAKKKVDEPAKKDLLYDIDVMINQSERGQDPPRSKAN